MVNRFFHNLPSDQPGRFIVHQYWKGIQVKLCENPLRKLDALNLADRSDRKMHDIPNQVERLQSFLQDFKKPLAYLNQRLLFDARRGGVAVSAAAEQMRYLCHVDFLTATSGNHIDPAVQAHQSKQRLEVFQIHHLMHHIRNIFHIKVFRSRRQRHLDSIDIVRF